MVKDATPMIVWFKWPRWGGLDQILEADQWLVSVYFVDHWGKLEANYIWLVHTFILWLTMAWFKSSITILGITLI